MMYTLPPWAPFVSVFVFAFGCVGEPPPTDSQDTACEPGAYPALPDFHAAFDTTEFTVVPSELDPETNNYPQSHHRVILPSDPDIVPRDELFLMLPGTSNLPSAFDEIGHIAARAGYPVIVLAWDSELHPGEICSGLTEEEELAACRTAVVEEKAYGVDVSPLIEVGEADSVVGRLVRLLAAADAVAPELGASRYLDGDAPAWREIVVAGFSQGSMMAGWLSGDHEVARSVLLAGGCDTTLVNGEVYLAPWCFDPRATPADRTWALAHEGDAPAEHAATHEVYGLDALGPPGDADALSPPEYCAGTRALWTDLPSGDAAGDETGTRYHLSVAHDDYLLYDAQDVPVLSEDLWHLFTAE